MKISTIVLTSITSAAETDETAISTLRNLEKSSLEIFFSESINESSRWKGRWERKMRKNVVRMRQTFEFCGTKHDELDEEIDIDYDIANPCRAITGLINGFSEWVDRYISSCKAQKKNSHHKNRLGKWNNILNEGKRFKLKSIIINESWNKI